MEETTTRNVQVSQDTLYQYLTEHNVKMARIAELIGKSEATVSSCFRHCKDMSGRPRRFTPAAISSLNAALKSIATSLRLNILTFGSPETFTNQRGNTYDPALVEPLKKIGELMNITALTARLLGWSKDRKEGVLVSPSAKIYGCISREDVNRINAELLSVAGVLSSYEVVSDDGAINPDKQDNKPIKTKKINKGTPAPVCNEWDDTTVDLWARYAAFHRLFPDGLIAFTVCGGFTVCEDDARLLAHTDTTLKPYTDPVTCHVTLHMDAAKWQQIRRAWNDGDEMVAESPMYEQ